MFLFGPPNIAKLKEKRDVQSLIKALKYRKDSNIPLAAIDALAELGDPQVIPSLIELLTGADDDIRQQAIITLGRMRAVAAVDALIKILDENAFAPLGQYAAEALGNIGDARAVPVLVKIAANAEDKTMFYDPFEVLEGFGTQAVALLLSQLTHKNEKISRRAAAALGKMGWQPGKDADSANYWIALGQWEHCIALGDAAVEPLLKFLKKRPVGHFTAIETLGKMGDARAIPPLLKLLDKSEGAMRRGIVQALTALGWKPEEGEAGAAHWIALEDWDKCVALGVPAAVPLLAAMKDNVNQISKRDAVGQKNPYFLELVTQTHQKLMDTLLRIGSPAIPSLLAAMQGKDDSLAQYAAEALEKLGWQPEAGASAAAYWAQRGNWDKCVEIGADAVEPLLARLNTTKDSHTQVNIIAALEKIGEDAAVKPLIQMISRRNLDAAVAQAAIHALGALGDEQAVLPLVKVTKDHHDYRRPVIRALAVMGGLEAWTALNAFAQVIREEKAQMQSLYGSQGMAFMQMTYHAEDLEFEVMAAILTASENLHAGKSRKKIKGGVYYAYFTEAPADAAFGAFAHQAVITHSMEEWKDKIRQEAGDANADVTIVPAEEWEPPAIRSLTEADLKAVFPAVLRQVQKHANKIGLPATDDNTLIQNGFVTSSRVSGKIFFVYRFKGT
jgi:HEAT repeat protein